MKFNLRSFPLADLRGLSLLVFLELFMPNFVVIKFDEVIYRKHFIASKPKEEPGLIRLGSGSGCKHLNFFNSFNKN